MPRWPSPWPTVSGGNCGTDLAAAVTGIAGPGGATADKPVGLTYVAASDDTGSVVRRFAWDGDRDASKEASASAVLDLLVERAEALARVQGGG